MIHFATRNALLALLAAVVFLAPPAAAQDAPTELQARPSVQSAYQAAQTSSTDAFRLSNEAGVELLRLDPLGLLFVGDLENPGFEFESVLNVQNDDNTRGGIIALQNAPESTRPAFWAQQRGLGIGADIGTMKKGIGANFYRLDEDETGEPVPAVIAYQGGNGSALDVTHAGGDGAGAEFRIASAANTGAAVSASTEGTGPAGNFEATGGPAISAFNFGNDTGEFGALINAHQEATGNFAPAGYFHIENANNGSDALIAKTTGLGQASFFEINNANNDRPALGALTAGTGQAAYFERSGDGSDFGPAVQIRQSGSATFNDQALLIEQFNESTDAEAVRIVNNGNGPSIRGLTTGGGPAASFNINNSSNNAAALEASTSGIGQAAFFERNGDSDTFAPAVQITQNGTASFGPAVAAEIRNSSNGSPAVFGTTEGTGVAGEFVNNNTSNGAPALAAITNSTGDIAHFNAGSEVRMVVANNGDVFADGTFQGGGADVAEAFEVEGAVTAYEPGDVLVISTERDRTVTRSGAAYSTRVVGVYATKPGVLLSEKGMATNWDERVPMGVIGVIPTKVTLEGGAIQRGDLLVTSSTAGHAMKANLDNVGFGQVIGKALQPYDGTGPALIEVLVNVK